MTRAPDIRSSSEMKRRVPVVVDDRNFADGRRNLLALEGSEIGVAYRLSCPSSVSLSKST